MLGIFPIWRGRLVGYWGSVYGVYGVYGVLRRFWCCVIKYGKLWCVCFMCGGGAGRGGFYVFSVFWVFLFIWLFFRCFLFFVGFVCLDCNVGWVCSILFVFAHNSSFNYLRLPPKVQALLILLQHLESYQIV